MLLKEPEMLSMLKNSKKVVLLEPNYRRKYVPLGLAKIASYVKANGGEVVFQRSYRPCKEDTVCVTTLFTYESEKVFQELSHITTANFFSGNNPKVVVGGVFASLMPDVIQNRFPKVDIFVGYSKTLDQVKPDYSIDWGIDEKWQKFSFAFTSRGCPNRCAYCAVHRIEQEIWINPNWKNIVDTTKPHVMLSDNNLSAQPIDHIKEVCQFLKENKLKVVFDNGFDCKHVTPEIAQLFATVPFMECGLRLAFDRIQENGIFQQAVTRLLDAGVPKSKMMAYVLFNFNDTPKEATFRMEENVRLGIRPYPQQYTPLNTLNRDTPHIGKYWNKKSLKTFRYFWLMRGLHTKQKFATWVSKPETVKKFSLTDDDFTVLLEAQNCQPLVQCLQA